MATDHKQRFKLDYSAESEAGMTSDFRPVNLTRHGYFREEYLPYAAEKGKLFVVADAKVEAGDVNVAEMAVQIIRENYFAYPSDDIGFCLKRAFDIANRKIYQYAQAHGLEQQIGASCSALVLTDRWAYIAHIGDCRVYGMSIRRSEQLTQDHIRVIEMMPEASGYAAGAQETVAMANTTLSRALGVSLGIKVDLISKIPVHRDEYFVLTTNAFRTLATEEIRRVVFSSTPQAACRQIMKMGRRRDSHSSLTLQVVKIYQEYDTVTAAAAGTKTVATLETAAAADLPKRRSHLGHYLLLLLMILIFSLTYRDSISQRLPEMLQEAIINNSSLLPGAGTDETIYDYSADLEQANRLFENRELRSAQAYYQKVLRYDKDNANALAGIKAISGEFVELGDSRFVQRNWSSALIFYRQASTLRPDDRELLNKVAETETKLKQSSSRSRRSTNSSRRNMITLPANIQPELPTRPIESSPEPLWRMPGLDVGKDYRMPQPNSLQLEKNIRVKKVFQTRKYRSAEIETRATVHSGSADKKYGIIFGHQLNEEGNPVSFYLFALEPGDEYTLQRVTPQGVEFLDAGRLPDDVDHRKEVGFRLKWDQNIIVYWINGICLKIYEADESIEGGVGFYGDGNMQVEFNDIVITPGFVQ